MARPTCFVIMPFEPALHYMYLYLEQYLERQHGLDCRRGDSEVLTVPLLEKIRRAITDADLVIADCSGRNPNVFYELGMAHVLEKPVVLITRDEIEDAPTDIKAFEFIHYTLDDHKSFLRRMDLAIKGVMGSGLDQLFVAAKDLLDLFKAETGMAPAIKEQEVFERDAAPRLRALPAPEQLEERQLANFLPDLIAPPIDLDVMVGLQQWVKARYG